jgi:CHAD domain-containing protein
MSTALPPASLAAALKKRAMTLDANLIRRLRAARRLSFRLLHDTRLATKRQRAWWRLMLPVAGKPAVRRADDRLATAARLLAPMRDAYVMRRMLGRLARQADEPGVRAALDAGARQMAVAGPEGAAPPAFSALRERLTRALASDAAAWRRLPAAPAADPLILDQMVQAYRRARRRAGGKDLHAWRRWVKVHLAQMEFLHAERSRALGRHLRPLARLGRLLGRCQDLAVLDGWFDWRESAGAVGRKEARRLHAFLDRRRKSLRRRCARLGGQLLAAKPKALALRLHRAARVPVGGS